jgi:Glucosamine-6-phosphate isomerases/6-phosphogluconolactonase
VLPARFNLISADPDRKWLAEPAGFRAPGRCSLASRPGYCRDRPSARIPRSARSATPLLAGRGMRTAAAAGHGGGMKPTRALHEAGQSLRLEHTLVTEPDAAQLAAKAAGFMADRIRSAIAANGTFTCAVSGGQTPWLMLTELAKHDLPWSSVEIYQVDERARPDGDPERNLTHLRQILGSVPVTLIPMPVTDPDLEAAALTAGRRRRRSAYPAGRCRPPRARSRWTLGPRRARRPAWRSRWPARPG